MKIQKNVETVSLVIDTIKPDTAEKWITELKLFLADLDNKHVDMIHTGGNGSKYLWVYTTPPDLVIRVSDHPTGNENAVQVTSKSKLLAETYKRYMKIKKKK